MFEKKLILLPDLHQTSHALNPPFSLISEVVLSAISVNNPKPKSAASADVADLDVGIPFFIHSLLYILDINPSPNTGIETLDNGNLLLTAW
jgi:hypothetical protein